MEEHDGGADPLLERMRSGDDAASEELFELLYDRLKAMAGQAFRRLSRTSWVGTRLVWTSEGARTDTAAKRSGNRWCRRFDA